MLKNFKQRYFDRWRYINVFLFALGAALYTFVKIYWADICVPLDCSTYFMGGYLAPLREAGLVIAAATFIFLLVPTYYFKNWLLWIFTPLTVLALYRLSTIDPNSSNMFADTREEFVAGLLIPWLIVTLLFIVYHYFRSKK